MQVDDGVTFVCSGCRVSLIGQRYIRRDDKMFCLKCYDRLFAKVCQVCKTAIGVDSKDLSYKDAHWHDRCFSCCQCSSVLVDRQFASKDGKLYCPDCYDNNFAPRCHYCKSIFRAGMKKFEYKNRHWHEQCFKCKLCQKMIGADCFIPRDQEVVCVECYEKHYAQCCIKCNKTIASGGITYKNAPWHRECFVCTSCTRPLMCGEKFTSHEERPYCPPCFANLFAKRCCRCTKPITGAGGTRFISFEERHWHMECFVCYRCTTSLVGRGFLNSATEVLCADCGRI